MELKPKNSILYGNSDIERLSYFTEPLRGSGTFSKISKLMQPIWLKQFTRSQIGVKGIACALK